MTYWYFEPRIIINKRLIGIKSVREMHTLIILLKKYKYHKYFGCKPELDINSINITHVYYLDIKDCNYE